MVEIVSSYAGFIFGLFEFFWVKIVEADWYLIPFLVLSFLFALACTLFLSIWVLLALWRLITILLSLFQITTGIKFPFIGSWLQTSLTASEKRVAKIIYDRQKYEKNMALAYINYNAATKELPDDEIFILRKILQLDQQGDLVEALKKYEQIPDVDKQFYRKEFETGELDKWMEINKQSRVYF